MIPGGVERRRTAEANPNPIELLDALPALVVLDRIPVPVLAVGRHGVIVYANASFATMLGQNPDKLLSGDIHHIFPDLASASNAVRAIRANGDRIVRLAHADGATVWAKMSTSAMVRGDDALTLTTSDDLTEQVWSTSTKALTAWGTQDITS